ncbi:MAG: sugar phosphate isomerase/epimerase family protein [Thermoprotei archaeon]
MKISAGLWAFGNMADRFATGGYREPLNITKVIGGLTGISGVEFNYSPALPIEELKSACAEKGLSISSIGVDLFSDPKWKFGALSSEDPNVRQQALEHTYKVIDLASDAGALVNVWPGQDGYDYPFQNNYPIRWQNMVESLEKLADYNKSVKISLEYKPREPRVHEVPGNMGEALLMVEEANRRNLGITIDVGHSLMVGEGLSHALSLALSKNKLFHLHLNDNFGLGDDDLAFGVVHRVEFLEMIYWAIKLGYDGWYSFDVFPYRENPFRTIEVSTKNLLDLYEKAKKLTGVPDTQIGERISEVLQGLRRANPIFQSGIKCLQSYFAFSVVF